jgi:hypothetical protein
MRARHSVESLTITCPLCGSANLRYAHVRGFGERMLSLGGIRPLRCRNCRHRFAARTWSLAAALYARCPRCWRTDLARWSEQYSEVSLWTRLAMRLGAHRFRCEYCRVNFASFRPRLTPYRRVSEKARAARK